MQLPICGSPALETIGALLREAGRRLTAEETLEVRSKAAFDFVTQVDVEVQRSLERSLAEAFPDIAFLGEEGECRRQPGRASWLLDPVDGTTNLIHRRRYSCISLGLTDGERLVFGAIYDPFADEFFHAADGDGAYVNGRRLAVSPERDPAQALMIVSSGSSNKAMAREQMRLVSDIQQQVVDIRISGSSSLNLAYAAAGRGSALLSSRMNPWDAAAGIVLVREAGGVVTDYAGQPVEAERTTSIVAGNPTLHAWLLEQVAASGILHSPAYLAL